MKYVLLFLLAVSPFSAFAQNLVEKTGEKLCLCLDAEETPPSAKIDHCVDLYLQREDYAFFSDSVYTEFFYRVGTHLSKYCQSFRTVWSEEKETEATIDHWRVLDSVPDSEIGEEAFEHFFLGEQMYYIQTGDQVNGLELSKAFWIDHLNEGQSYSKCKVEWIKWPDFEISFIESDDPHMIRFSEPGDRYRYRVVKKLEDYYLLVVTIDDGVIYEFRVYTTKPSLRKM